MEAILEIEIFFSYAHEDQQLRRELEKHLSPLKRQGHITNWYDRDISAGTEWASEIDKHLKTAQIILLLISSDFIASDYCYGIEMREALERHAAGTARVIPIILRPANWQDTPLCKLQVLPRNNEPVISHPSRDKAFLDVAEGIKKAIEDFRSKSPALLTRAEHAYEKSLSIQGAARSLEKVFSNEYIFTIPLFQRSYAWTTEQAEALLDDLLLFMDESNESDNEYFLGSIVLIKAEEPYAAVVDGQQRLTTLTILLAVLRALLPRHASNLTPFLHQQGNSVTGAPNTYRLLMRARDAKFFEDYIQRDEKIEKIEKIDVTGLSESQKNIRENALLFLNRLRTLSEDQLLCLTKALVTHCFLVVVSTPSFESAYRIFSVLNDRGLNLTPGDILKAEIIGKIAPEAQKEYTKKWEDIEELLGSEMFQALFADICMIHCKSKLKDTVLAEFRQHIRPTISSSQQFIDEILSPYANAFYTVTKAAYEGSQDGEAVNCLLLWLKQVEHSDWLPPAIFYLVRNYDNTEELKHFFTNLERLTAGLMLLRENASKRIERYCQVLRAIDSNQNLYAVDSPLQLTTDEQREILNLFKGDLSPIQGRLVRYVLLRLNAAISGARAPAKDAIITVEQVLPPSATSDEWSASFGVGPKRNRHVNSLGNMVLLLRKRDTKLQNLGFAEKKRKYFSSDRANAPFMLTEQVLQAKEWTPAVVEERRKTLVNKLEDIWRL